MSEQTPGTDQASHGDATVDQSSPHPGHLGVGQPAYLGNVVVIGAGVTGLSAAHELVERGFNVTILEEAMTAGPSGRPDDVTVGGIARTQYVVPKPFDPQAPSPGPMVETRRDWIRRTESGTIDKEALRKLLSSWRGEFSATSIRVISFSEVLEKNKEDAKDAIQEIWKPTSEESVVSAPVPQPIWIDQPSWMKPPADRPADSFPILIETTTPLVPGEHGYRFFPSYYRHLRDTLARIPIVDDSGEPTGSTVYDNLEPSPYMAFVSNRHSPTVFPRLPGVGLRDRIQQWIAAESLNGTPRDAAQYVNRLMRYMTLSPQRRVELEDMSWIEYLIGRDPSTGGPLYHYSDTFLKNLAFSGRILAALDNRWADARTCGDVFVQLALSHFYVEDKVDASLNAPTSEAWFRPWRRWLESRGVKFVRAEVAKIDVNSGRARAAFNGTPPDLPSEYYLLVATDLISAAELIKSAIAPPANGAPVGPDDSLAKAMLAQVERFSNTVFDPNTRTVHPRSDDDKSIAGQEPWHRLQTLAGVQFFFDRSFSGINGHMYFIDAPWALSTVNSQIFWRRKPVLSRDGYVSIMSVDVGAWHRRAEIAGTVVRKSAAESTAIEVAHTVWGQITASYPGVIKRHRHGAGSDKDDSVDIVHGPPRPRWFHIDENIVFGADGKTKVTENRQPYLLPIKRDWRNRPGTEPWDPTLRVDWPVPAMSAQTVRFTDADPWWQSTHGGYPVLYNNLVLAGTYLKTFTRMTTMESANESARHAVNAILLHHLTADPRQRAKRARFEGELVVAREQREECARVIVDLSRKKTEALDLVGQLTTIANQSQLIIALIERYQGDVQRFEQLETEAEKTKLKLDEQIATLERHLKAIPLAQDPSPPPGNKSLAGSSSGGAIRMAARHGDYGAQEVFPSTPEGDLCRIWDPEFNETDEFLSLRLLDLALYQANMPPLWDILGLQSLPQLTPDFAQFVEPERDPRRPAEASRMSALHAFARSIGLPGIPVPARNGPEMRVPTDGLGIGAIDSMLAALRANIEPGELNKHLETLRGIRTAFEHALRNPPGAGR